MNDYGFYIDGHGRTITECQCGSFVVFQKDSTALSRLCFRCGQTVERPILEVKRMAPDEGTPLIKSEEENLEEADTVDLEDVLTNDGDDEDDDEDEDRDMGIIDDEDISQDKEF